ncbi:hypothetical protein HNP38_002248 [Chryseobacterium defluvii]|uniref:Uncharacterized protein n=1 Tax=Chryseobacterium defluvii TaxID=160396 RepID=A0A840KJ94_9FLAO|nr:hypothetical protein [Chryseobacterium defluvii]MBB4806952.1 hypothetical protein [Chryseobacterium defluvii]
MKNTENIIKEKTIKILNDLTEGVYNEDNIVNINFHEKNKLTFPTEKIIDVWVISIKSLFDNRDFLIISDETGEPIYYHNFNYIKSEIIKNSDEAYQYKK